MEGWIFLRHKNQAEGLFLRRPNFPPAEQAVVIFHAEGSRGFPTCIIPPRAVRRQRLLLGQHNAPHAPVHGDGPGFRPGGTAVPPLSCPRLLRRQRRQRALDQEVREAAPFMWANFPKAAREYRKTSVLLFTSASCTPNRI